MRKQYHILNGDALKQQFPESIEGEIIVARECLVDGDVRAHSLTELYKIRAEFIKSNYEALKEDYYKKTVPEFDKILNIEEEAEVNLWFEDDLFCQVNLWFVANLLTQSHNSATIYLIRPEQHNQYGFGGLNTSTLTALYTNRQLLTATNKMAQLWDFYQKGDTEQLLNTASELEPRNPFIVTAVKAHVERVPTDGNLGRPIQSLIQIMDDLKTEEFGPVFKEFCKRESIYGFGDLQVKRLLDEIKKDR